jgi:regulator of sigma E protease
VSYAAAIGAFLGFVVLIVLHEGGHFAAAKAVGMRVERFYLFFGRTPLRFRRGETEYGIGWLPAGGYVKISGMNPDEDLPDEVRDRAYHAQPVWKRVVVIAAGPAVNVVLALVLLLFFFAVIGVGQTSDRVGAVEPGSPAAGVLRPGDQIVSVDGVRGGPEQFLVALGRHRCAGSQRDGCRAAEPATIVVERGGREQTLSVRPVFDAKLRDELGPRPRVGLRFAPGEREALPFGQAVDRTLELSWRITRETATIPLKLADPVERAQISGVVGGYETTRQVIITDLDLVVSILALISLSLALVNLFPFLPLDGGHIFWAIVEKVRGRPVPLSVMERASVVGILLILILFSVGLTNDIGRLVSGEGFGVR